MASNTLITKSATAVAAEAPVNTVLAGRTAGLTNAQLINTAFAPGRLQGTTVKLDDLVVTRQVGGASFAAQQEDEKRRMESVRATGQVLEKSIVQAFEIERVDIIPTEALYVESQLGDCGLCEPYVMGKQELELESPRLENKLLEQQITLLAEHKVYRCCDDD